MAEKQKTQLVVQSGEDQIVDEIKLPTGSRHGLTARDAGRLVAGALRSELRVHLRAERLAAAVRQGNLTLAEISSDTDRQAVTIALRASGDMPKVG